ncbi:MAG: NDP-sugar synthase [Deltaproteobacteria bacterium]|nr:MAG: NDP-sugar synthase [Deltaproteobacteria bacterium]
MIKKAMVLSAGLGTRLRPLTDHRPKPLVPILNTPLLEHHLQQLTLLGVEEVVINLHHLADQIQHHIQDGSRWNLQVHYSFEQPKVLGTGGGIAAVEEHFKNEEAFLVINGDIFHQINLQEALQHHKESGAVATLLVREHPGDPKVGSVDVDDHGWIRRVPEMPQRESLYKRMYTGMQILTPQIFPYLRELPPPPSCILRTGYRRMLEDGHPVASFHVQDSFWKDIGNPQSYLQSQWDAIDNNPSLATHNDLDPLKIVEPVLLGKNIQAEPGTQVGPYVIIGDNCKLGKGSVIQHSVVWDHTHVAENTVWDGVIAWDETVVATGRSDEEQR